MLGQSEILDLLAGPAATITQCNLALDTNDPEQFERGYQIAMRMRPCYINELYYKPTYQKIREAYEARDPARMHEALSKLCLDIVYR